jgi:hypothetical protein
VTMPTPTTVALPPAPQGWRLADANAARLQAIAAFGFTDRQARFLLEVLLHSGVFLERQYCQFAGIAHGQKTTNFINALIDGGWRRRSPPASCIGDGCSICTTSRCGR